jgi:hypothetical protein
VKDNNTIPPDPASAALARVRVSDEVHASIEHDTKGNPVIVLIAPLQLDEPR